MSLPQAVEPVFRICQWLMFRKKQQAGKQNGINDKGRQEPQMHDPLFARTQQAGQALQ
ncbi:hypothetical protein D3C72_1896030 [compost metagenome]